MTIPGGDRIKESSSTSGTASFVLTGAVAGEPVRAFASSENGQTVRYVAKHVTAQEAESGYGVYTHATRTLTRLYRYYPSRGAAAVSFSAGGLEVACTAIVGDFLANLSTSNPTVTDDINAGYLPGMWWINTSTAAVFVCVSSAAGAADWDQINSAVAGSLTLGDISDVGTATPTNRHLLQANGTTWEGVLSSLITGDFRGTGVETLAAAFTAITSGSDATPTQVTSNASPYALTAGSQLHSNARVTSHQNSVDFEVPAATAAYRAWRIYPVHTSCTVSVVGNVGSVNGVAGGTVTLNNGGVAIVEVESNAGSAPVVTVRGDVIIPAVDVGGAKTYNNDDNGQNFRLTSTTTQTFSAAAGYVTGWYVNLFKETSGNVTLDGVDRDYTMQPSATDPAAVTVMKVGTAIIAVGTNGSKSLDDA